MDAAEFVDAVDDAGDRAFLQRFLQLMDANGQRRREGTHARLTFGKKPGGALFVYPFGRRFPPFKFSVKNGQLMVAGCWRQLQPRAIPGLARSHPYWARTNPGRRKRYRSRDSIPTSYGR